MTRKTELLYFKLWSKAYKAHWSGERGGEVIPRAGRPEHCEMRDQVMGFARRIAAQCGGGIRADYLRHACHVVAIGKNCGHRTMTHKQVTQVLAVFRQLAGIDLSAMATTDAAEAEATRYRNAKAAAARGEKANAFPVAGRDAAMAAIQRLGFGDEYIGRITADRWGTSNWRSLSSLNLTQLLMTLKVRAGARSIADSKRTVMAGGL